MKKLAACVLLFVLMTSVCGAENVKTAQELFDENPVAPVLLDRDPYLIPEIRLVNKSVKLDQSYVPELVTVELRHKPGLAQQKLTSEAYEALKALFAAADRDGIELCCVSGYRAYSTQRSIYNKKVEERGKASASLSSAPPGCSEHQLGLAMDVSSKSISYRLNTIFANSEEGKWLAAHCAEFGFIIRYKTEWTKITTYKGEPWHIRYVGREHAEAITALNVPLETYLEYLEMCWLNVDQTM